MKPLSAFLISVLLALSLTACVPMAITPTPVVTATGATAVPVISTAEATAAVTATTPATVPSPPARSPEIQWRLRSGRDYAGLAQLGAVAGDGSLAHLATLRALYKIEGGRTIETAERFQSDSSFALAPGGEVYVWLAPQAEWQGLFMVELYDMENQQLGTLKLGDFPHGFTALYLGFRGRLIVTASPLRDWQTIEGPVLYTFWDRAGQELGRVEFPERQQAYLDALGSAIIFLGPKMATAYDASGVQLWEVPGEFRKASISEKAGLTLLNPASLEEIDQVVVRNSFGATNLVKIPSPVHVVSAKPSGTSGIVVGDGGRYWFLSPDTGELSEPKTLPLEGYLFVTDVEWINEDTAVFGALRARGESNKRIWPEGFVIAVNTKGDALWMVEFKIPEATSTQPNIDVAFDDKFLIIRTNETTLQVSVAQ